MTETTETLLQKYQIRKNKKQKSEFIEYVKTESEKMGYTAEVEKGLFGARNIVIGSPKEAKLLFTAHYDTCPVLPFPNFITPKKLSIYIAYQILLVLGLIAIIFAFEFLLGVALGLISVVFSIPEDIFMPIAQALGVLTYLLVFFLLLAGPANKHTANDNTSGVATLFEIMRDLPEEERKNVCFVFFDLEEMGLFGSAGFKEKHKKDIKNKLLINFDCVSDGNEILLAVNKKANGYIPLLTSSFVSDGRYSVDITSKGVFYPSDQANFDLGVGVAALKYSKRLKTVYMDRIHTKKDVIFEYENILFLKNCAINLVNEINKE